VGSDSSDASADFRERVGWALDGAADLIECGGATALGGIVPSWLLERIDEPTAHRFGRAARELAQQIESGRWDTSLSRCTANELLLQRCIDQAEWSAEMDEVDCSADAEAARTEVLLDDDVLLFWMPEAQLVCDRGVMDEVLTDGPSANPATWFDRFATCRLDRAEGPPKGSSSRSSSSSRTSSSRPTLVRLPVRGRR